MKSCCQREIDIWPIIAITASFALTSCIGATRPPDSLDGGPGESDQDVTIVDDSGGGESGESEDGLDDSSSSGGLDTSGPKPCDVGYMRVTGTDIDLCVGMIEATYSDFNACVEAGKCDNGYLYVPPYKSPFEYADTAIAYDLPIAVGWRGAAQLCAWFGGQIPARSEMSNVAIEVEKDLGGVPGSCPETNRFPPASDGEIGCSFPLERPRCGCSPIGGCQTQDIASGLCDIFGNMQEWGWADVRTRDLCEQSLLNSPAGESINAVCANMVISMAGYRDNRTDTLAFVQLSGDDYLAAGAGVRCVHPVRR